MAELATAIPADVDAAWIKVEAFRDLRRQMGKLAPTDATMLRAYEAIVDERKVIDFHGAMLRGGWNAQRLPALAIARADAEVVALDFDTRPVRGIYEPYRVEFCSRPDKRVQSRGRGQALHPLRLRTTTDEWQQPDWTGWDSWKARRMVANVPAIPPDIRSENSLALLNYHILFEPQWYESEIQPKPADPYLLRYLGGSLFAVLVEWDITEIEALAMGAVI